MLGASNETKDSNYTARIVFFVTLPREQKGLTGAVIGTQTVIDAITSEPSVLVEIVERRHTRIRTTQTRFSPGALFMYFCDYFYSVRVLRETLARDPDLPTTLYLSAASSTAGTFRDLGAIWISRQLKRRTRVVLHSRNGDFFYSSGVILSALRKWELQQAQRVICLSSRLLPQKVELERLMSGDTKKRIKVVPNTIDDAMVATSAEIMRKMRREATITVLYLSNFIPSKGFLLLAEAIRNIERAGRLEDFRFVFRGNWPDPAMKNTLIATLGEAVLKSGSVEIGGGIWDRGEVRQTLLAADVFCLPTNYSAEAQPRSILEAMACGCAILATDHASIADMVIHGENGALVEKGSAQGIATFLLEVDRDTLRRQGIAARKLFNEQFARDRHDLAVREALLWS